MYEIWLLVVIAWEWMLANLAWLWPVPVVGMLGCALAFKDGARWQRGLQGAAWVGVVAAVATFFALPSSIASSLSELRYWVDWAALSGSALAAGAIVGLVSWPWWSRWVAARG